MGLAEFLMVFVSVMFALAAVLAMLWSYSSGQWNDLSEAAQIIAEDIEPIGWEDINEERRLRRARNAD